MKTEKRESNVADITRKEWDRMRGAILTLWKVRLEEPRYYKIKEEVDASLKQHKDSTVQPPA